MSVMIRRQAYGSGRKSAGRDIPNGVHLAGKFQGYPCHVKASMRRRAVPNKCLMLLSLVHLILAML
jgi:hypothetical protein